MSCARMAPIPLSQEAAIMLTNLKWKAIAWVIHPNRIKTLSLTLLIISTRIVSKDHKFSNNSSRALSSKLAHCQGTRGVCHLRINSNNHNPGLRTPYLGATGPQLNPDSSNRQTMKQIARLTWVEITRSDLIMIFKALTKDLLLD